MTVKRNNIFSGMDILKNDVIYILSEKQNSKSERNRKYSKFPGTNKQISKNEVYAQEIIYILCVLSLDESRQVFIQKSEVVSLRTSKKTLPGRKLAIYIGCVIAVLVLSYNLTKDLSFILVSNKERVLYLTGLSHY